MKVLFATDGFAPARAAEGLLRRMGDRGSLEVTVLSVAAYEPLVPERAEVLTAVLGQLRRQAERIVEEAVGRLREDGFRATGATAEGGPGRAILERLESGRFDLVVMGAGSHSRLHNAFLGSTSMVVLHSSPKPVLIVHETLPSDRFRILVATDGSTDSSAAAGVLAEIADRAVCDVTVASVAPLVSATAVAGFPIPVYPLGLEEAEERATARLTERAQIHVEEVARRLRTRGFGVTTRVLQGHPTELLLKEAESGSFDLVVVGSRGLGALKRTFLGSTSDAVARHAHAALVAQRLLT